MRRPLAALLLAAALAAIVPGAAAAQSDGDTTTVTAGRGDLRAPPPGDRPPPGRELRAAEAIAIAERVPEVRAELAALRDDYARAYLKGDEDWQVSFYTPARRAGEPRDEVAQVRIRDRDGRVLEAWTGVQVEWTMARGYPGAFGRQANSPWIWIGLCVLFVAPFLRRPLRPLHADLLALLAFSGSYAAFGDGNLAVSVPTAAALLVYLLVRSLWVAWRPPAPRPPLRLPSGDVLLAAVVFMLGFRIGLNVTDGNVIDVGYSGVIGADRILDGDLVYGGFPSDNARGDTYGPVVYLAYVPFVALFGWTGTWDDLPAAHGAAIAFDLLAMAAIWLLGRRVRGPRFGALLAYLWATCPFTLLVSNSSSNDALVGALVALALLAAARPAAAGAATALAGLTKFAPLALLPLVASHGWSRAAAVRTTAGFAAAAAVVLAPVLLAGDLATFWGRTLGFQGDRDSPFSPWGWYGGLDGAQTAVQVATAGLALVVAFVPRRRDLVTVCALAAAVLIAAQLAVTHWFYLYIAWFLPPLLVALVAPVVADADSGRERAQDLLDRPRAAAA